jgi:hypothetical protein
LGSKRGEGSGSDVRRKSARGARRAFVTGPSDTGQRPRQLPEGRGGCKGFRFGRGSRDRGGSGGICRAGHCGDGLRGPHSSQAGTDRSEEVVERRVHSSNQRRQTQQQRGGGMGPGLVLGLVCCSNQRREQRNESGLLVHATLAEARLLALGLPPPLPVRGGGGRAREDCMIAGVLRKSRSTLCVRPVVRLRCDEREDRLPVALPAMLS